MTEYSPAKTEEYPRIFPNYQNCACCEKDLKDTKHNSLHLAPKYVEYLSLSVPRRSQFTSSYALVKLFASWNRQCPRTNIPAYFRAKWRLLFIYLKVEYIENLENLRYKKPVKYCLLCSIQNVFVLFYIDFNGLVSFLPSQPNHLIA